MELQRWKKKRDSRMHIEPSNFPSASPISSLCIIAARERGDNALTLSNAILAALWEDDRNIDDPEVLKDICFENELDGNQILTTAKTSKIEKLFETDTNGAIKKGVFGAPTYLIDGEIFWGQDRLDYALEEYNS